jgi:hypothetical protein
LNANAGTKLEIDSIASAVINQSKNEPVIRSNLSPRTRKKVISKMKRKIKNLGRKLELAAIAVTFAEAGEWEVAGNYLKKIENLNRSKNQKMLVVSLDSGFLPDTVEYTVNLAERMQFDVLAVNVRPQQSSLLFRSAKRKQPSENTIKSIFRLLVEKTIEKKINCEAMIINHDFHEQIKRVLRQIHQVKLIIVQLQRDQDFSLGVSIPVYKIFPEGSAG